MDSSKSTRAVNLGSTSTHYRSQFFQSGKNQLQQMIGRTQDTSMQIVTTWLETKTNQYPDTIKWDRMFGLRTDAAFGSPVALAIDRSCQSTFILSISSLLSPKLRFDRTLHTKRFINFFNSRIMLQIAGFNDRRSAFNDIHGVPGLSTAKIGPRFISNMPSVEKKGRKSSH